MASRPPERCALIAIRPPFAAAILDGTKRVEFRRRPLAPDIRTVLMYVTQPTGQIVGAFTVARQRTGSPNSLWRRYRAVGGIDRASFFEYFDGTPTGVAIEVADPRVLTRPVELADVGEGIAVPQSYRYLDLGGVPALAMV